MNALTTTSKTVLLSPMMVFPVFTALRAFTDTANAFWFAIYIWQITVLIIIMKE